MYLTLPIKSQDCFMKKTFIKLTWSSMPDIIGANIEPIRANIDAIATALFLMTVGNNSAVYM